MGPKTRSSPAVLAALPFLAATIVMLFLCLLAGLRQSTPLNQIWFLQADTSGIPNAPALSHFTMYQACEDRYGRNHNCRPSVPAFPMLPQRYFNTETNVPQSFLRHPNKYFYLSRFTYAFYIISIAFCVLALFASLLALCSTLATAIAAALTAVAAFCVTFTTCIMTACYVMAQNAFRNTGRFARVGVKAFALTWTSLACTIIAFLLLLAGFGYRFAKSHKDKLRSKKDSFARLWGQISRPRRARAKRKSYDESKAKRSYESDYNAEMDRGGHKGRGQPNRGEDRTGSLERDYLGERRSATPTGYPPPPPVVKEGSRNAGYGDKSVPRGKTRFASKTYNGEYTVPGGRSSIGQAAADVGDVSSGKGGAELKEISYSPGRAAENIHLNLPRRSAGAANSDLKTIGQDEVGNSTIFASSAPPIREARRT